MTASERTVGRERGLEGRRILADGSGTGSVRSACIPDPEPSGDQLGRWQGHRRAGPPAQEACPFSSAHRHGLQSSPESSQHLGAMVGCGESADPACNRGPADGVDQVCASARPRLRGRSQRGPEAPERSALERPDPGRTSRRPAGRGSDPRHRPHPTFRPGMLPSGQIPRHRAPLHGVPGHGVPGHGVPGHGAPPHSHSTPHGPLR